MFEKPPTLPASKPEKKALDDRWYSRFEEIGAFQAYEYLDGGKEQRAEEKRAFLAEEKQAPNLDYPLLNEEVLLTRNDELIDLKEKILSEEENEVVKNVYRWRLNEKIAENRLLLAAATGDMRRFNRYSEFIYGKPSPDIFAYTVSKVREEIEKYCESNNQKLKELSASFLEELPALSKPEFALPSKELQSLVQVETWKELGHLINIPVEGPTEFDATEIKQAFERALQELSAEGWLVVINPNKAGISVNQEKKTVEIPEKRILLSQNLKPLILHEIGTHTARRINGERTRLRLLGLGLDRYEGGEEGIATLREQVLRGEVNDFSGFAGYFSIGLAKGVDGKPRDFRQVFNYLFKYHFIKNLAADIEETEARKKAEDSAWGSCVRTFRGTDSKTPGVCFTKDLVYRDGSIGVWETVQKNAPEMKRWNIGKYDPSNPRHIWILDQLGITDTELETLEKG